MNVAVERQLADDLPRLSCDGSQIQQVLLNLIINAAEAVQHREDARVTVRTLLDEAAREIILEVEDNGEGISPDLVGRIFDPFFTTKEEGKGVGLGLAVVYGIVQAHRGDIDVRTVEGAGTTFVVHLPLESPEENGVSEQGHTSATN
jgi:two-component system NtrC family sensor kinase